MTDTPDPFAPVLPRPCPHSERVQSDWADPRTPARRHLADAMVTVVGHEHVAVYINGHTPGIAEAGIGPGPVGIIGIASSRKRGNHCPRTSQHNHHPP